MKTTLSFDGDTVAYYLQGNALTQDYRSQFHDNVRTTVAIPVQLSKALNETCYQLVELNKGELFQRILDATFHEYFDLHTMKTEKLD